MGVPNRRAVSLLMVLLAAACHEWRIDDVAPKTVPLTRQPATVRVTRMDGSQIVLMRAVVQGDTLSGDTLAVSGRDTSEQRHIRIPLSEVQQIATRVPSADRTVGLGLGIAAGLAAAWFVFVAVVVANCDACH